MDVDSWVVVLFVTMIIKYVIDEKWQFKILLERPMMNKYFYLVYGASGVCRIVEPTFSFKEIRGNY